MLQVVYQKLEVLREALSQLIVFTLFSLHCKVVRNGYIL